MTTITQTLTVLPTAPARSQVPLTFIANADAFIGALALFQTQQNTLTGQINTVSGEVATNAATTATNTTTVNTAAAAVAAQSPVTNAAAAAASATAAANSATAAANSAGGVNFTLTSVSTLTNKTLTAPVINGFNGTGNGAMTGNLAVTGALSVTGTISQGASIGEKLLAYVSGNVKYGVNVAGGQMQLYAPSGNVVNIGTMSSVDGFTFSNVATVSSTGLAVTGALSSTGSISTGGYTVATLPAGSVGDRAYVTDATTPTYNAALTGGGAVRIPVFKNATVWVSA